MTLTIDRSWSSEALPRNYQQGGETFCVVCQTAIDEPMNEHWKSKHPNDQIRTKPFGCPNCKQKFTAARAALAHQHKHVDHSPIRCALCILSNGQSIEIGAYRQGSAYEAKNMTYHMATVHGTALKDNEIDKRYLWLRTSNGKQQAIIVFPRVTGLMTQARSQELTAIGLPPLPLQEATERDSPPSAEPFDLSSPTEDRPLSHEDDLSCDTDMTDEDTGEETDNQAAAVTNRGEAVDPLGTEMDWTSVLAPGEDSEIEVCTTAPCSAFEFPLFLNPHKDPLPDGTDDYLCSELLPWLCNPLAEPHHNSPGASHSNVDVFLFEQQ